MNKFERIFSDDNQMAVAGDGVGHQLECKGDGGQVSRSDVGVVPYHVAYPMMHVKYLLSSPPPPEQNNWHKWKYYLPATSFAGGRKANKIFYM